MFAYKPELAMDDDEEAEDTIEREVVEEEDDGEVHELKEEVIDLGDVEVSTCFKMLNCLKFVVRCR